MSRKYRLILMIISCSILLIVGRLVSGSFAFITDDFWFAAGLLLLILLSLIDQPHFSKDSSIFVNGVTAALSLLLVEPKERDVFFGVFLVFVIYLVISSYILMWLREKRLIYENNTIQFVARLNRYIGRPEIIFSALFIWGIAKQFIATPGKLNALLLFWIVFSILNIPLLAKSIEQIFCRNKGENNENVVGELIGIQSKNVFLVRLFKNKRAPVKIHNYLEFTYSIDHKTRFGIILDVYLLNQEQWAKVLCSEEIEELFSYGHRKCSPNIIYSIEPPSEAKNAFLRRFVGIVYENTVIEKIKFEYFGKVEVCEGQLLEIKIQGHRVFYQVIQGTIKTQMLENKDETGLILGDAVQLGEWIKVRNCFEPFGWVPAINAPVFIASDLQETASLAAGEYPIGNIPNTSYRAIMNCNLAITHHLAIVGVTGSGKSVFARQVIRQFLCDEQVKVICVDFTGEYSEKLSDLAPYHFASSSDIQECVESIDKMIDAINSNYGKESAATRAARETIFQSVIGLIEAFLKDDSKRIAIFDLPEVENTAGVMVYTQIFFKALFNIAKMKNNFGKRISLVLEEAHTVIPEWNFAGISDKFSQPVLNSIAQIALQGRKYNIGLLVIAQRTANVSKTILTQCNSIVSFQQFDKTSIEFLASYFGYDVAASLTRLKFRQAIAIGKAFRSTVPMLFEVPQIDEQQGS